VTGDGTLYTIPYDTALTNVGSGFNTGTGVFTAPSDGQYSFSFTISYQDLALQTDIISIFNGSVYGIRGTQYGIVAGTIIGVFIDHSTWQIPMSTNDTMSIQAFAAGSTKTVSIFGAAPTSGAVATTFVGFKVA
jgi:hypothetical protein